MVRAPPLVTHLHCGVLFLALVLAWLVRSADPIARFNGLRETFSPRNCHLSFLTLKSAERVTITMSFPSPHSMCAFMHQSAEFFAPFLRNAIAWLMGIGGIFVLTPRAATYIRSEYRIAEGKVTGPVWIFPCTMVTCSLVTLTFFWPERGGLILPHIQQFLMMTALYNVALAIGYLLYSLYRVFRPKQGRCVEMNLPQVEKQ